MWGSLALGLAAVLLCPQPRLMPPHRLLQRGWPRRRNRDDLELQWVTAMAGELRSGSDPNRALQVCQNHYPVAAHATRAARIGGDVAEALALDARDGHSLLLTVAGVWEMATSTGAAFADVLQQVGQNHRRSQEVRRALSVELAGTRATARMMGLLPLVGIGFGFMLGTNPLAWLFGTPVGFATLLVGALLNAAGLLWIRHIVAGVERAL